MKTENLTHQHGGDLDAIERTYGILKSEICDFSGNINPLGFPENAKKLIVDNLNIISTYPDKNYSELKKSIANYTGSFPEYVCVGNGSTELISVFIESVFPKKSIIIGPSYSEYEHELNKIGSDFHYFPLEEKNNFKLDIDNLLNDLSEEIDLLVACNPNNPTGMAITVTQMDKILAHCKAKNISVMIDETYIEFSGNLDKFCSIPLATKYDNLFVIRGISKFFAAPGLRLGYGISSSQTFHSLLSKNQDPWSVNSIAAFAGEKIFSDEPFMKKTHSLICSERKKAFEELSTWKNIRAYQSESNFILLKLLTDKVTSAEIFEKLIQKKMLIRDAKSFAFLDDSFIRFCILLPEQNLMLLTALKELVE